MMTFISCAKTMTGRSKIQTPVTSTPQFQTEAIQNALDMSQFSAEELERLLRVNSKIAAENYMRFQDFCSDSPSALAALLAYTGIVYKRIHPQDFTPEDFQYAQDHLRITSFLYGLLRPLDQIKNYRMEGDIKLPERGGISMFDYWKPILTDTFIKEIKRRNTNQSGKWGDERFIRLETRGARSTSDHTRISGMEKRKINHRCGLCKNVPWRIDTLHH